MRIRFDLMGDGDRYRISMLKVEGVESVVVELESKLVTVSGPALDDAALRAAIEEAGYEAA